MKLDGNVKCEGGIYISEGCMVGVSMKIGEPEINGM